MINKIIEKGNLNVTSSQRDAFFKALQELISVFFAIVIGFGFQQFASTDSPPILSHSVALIVICLSWWGYFWGITCGPKEINTINILIDCALLITYWLLLNMYEYYMYIYPTIFILYVFWEYVRVKTSEDSDYISTLKKALKCNFFFFFIFTILFIFEYFIIKQLSLDTKNITPLLILLLTIIYRYCIGKIYTQKQGYRDQGLWISNAELIDSAIDVSRNSHAPISKYRVGAAIIGCDNKIYKGCNVEFANFSNTVHAEESALSNMIANGVKTASRIAVYTEGEEVAYPCGMCLQSLYEIGGNDLVVIACNKSEIQIKKISELLPFGFSLEE